MGQNLSLAVFLKSWLNFSKIPEEASILSLLRKDYDSQLSHCRNCRIHCYSKCSSQRDKTGTSVSLYRHKIWRDTPNGTYHPQIGSNPRHIQCRELVIHNKSSQEGTVQLFEMSCHSILVRACISLFQSWAIWSQLCCYSSGTIHYCHR